MKRRKKVQEMVTANRLQQAKKQLKHKGSAEFPTEIRKDEEGMYHVMIVDTKYNESSQKLVHKSKVAKYSVEAFESSESRFSKIGLSNLIIFHNPEMEEGEEDFEETGEGGSGTEGSGITVETIEQLSERISTIEDDKVLYEMLESEERKGAKEAIEQRILELG